MSANANLQRIIRQTLYQLKHAYGAPVDIYKLLDSNTNYRTGDKSATVSKTSVRYGVVLPASAIRKSYQSINYLTQSKSFVSRGGPGWDEDTRGFIFDGRDIPGLQFEVEDWIVYNRRRYEIAAIEELETQAGWLIVAKQLKGTEPNEIVDLNVVDTMILESEVA